MTSNRLRIGLIGTGSIACENHVPAIQQSRNCHLWSILSRSECNARSFCQRFEIDFETGGFTDIEAFLGDPNLQAVVVASPDKLHFEHASHCLKAGKHVLVEKPLAVSVDECDRLTTLADENGVELGVGLHLRWHAGIGEMLSLLAAGKVGTIRHVSMQWTFASSLENWRASQELGRWWALAGTGAHCLDLARRISTAVNATQKSVHGVLTNAVWGKNDETASVTKVYDNGMSISIFASSLFTSGSFIHIYGDTGQIMYDGALSRNDRGTLRLNDEILTFAFKDPYQTQIEAFSDAIEQDRRFPVGGKVGALNILDLVALEQLWT